MQCLSMKPIGGVVWNINFANLGYRFTHLLNMGKWIDCYFLVGPAPGTVIPAHKMLLSVASPVFERMFFGPLQEYNFPIEVPDSTPETFKLFLVYIYTDNIKLESFNTACELIYLARKYMVNDIEDLCLQYITETLSEKTALIAYEVGKLFEIELLMKRSMIIIAEKIQEILVDPSFLGVAPTTIAEIFDCDNLNIDNELTLFYGLENYANNYGITLVDENKTDDTDVVCKGTDCGNGDHQHETCSDIEMKDPDASKDEIKEMQYHVPNLPFYIPANSIYDYKSLLRRAVLKIRYLTLTPTQFVEGPARSKLLSPKESLNILINIISPFMADCPIPKGFSTCRSKRSYSEFLLKHDGERINSSAGHTQPNKVDDSCKRWERRVYNAYDCNVQAPSDR